MKRLTTESFIEKAKKVHGDLYDYSQSLYVSTSSQIKIICKKHGAFFQTPNNHLRSGGCNACGYERAVIKRRKSLSDFLQQAVSAHGDKKYIYDQVDYKGAHRKVKIRCVDHGYFLQDAAAHLAEKGCQKCYEDSDRGASARGNYKSFVEKAKSVHGETYNYLLFDYKSNKSIARMVCRVHGEFKQKVYDHLSGCGCPICNAKGFNPANDGFLYVLSSSDKVKVGITNNLKARIKKLKYMTPFNFTESFIVKGPGEKIIRLEKSIHKLFKNSKLKGFDGATEWFDIENGYLEKIQDHLIMQG